MRCLNCRHLSSYLQILVPPALLFCLRLFESCQIPLSYSCSPAPFVLVLYFLSLLHWPYLIPSAFFSMLHLILIFQVWWFVLAHSFFVHHSHSFCWYIRRCIKQRVKLSYAISINVGQYGARNFHRITNSSDHGMGWPVNLIHEMQLPNPLSHKAQQIKWVCSTRIHCYHTTPGVGDLSWESSLKLRRCHAQDLLRTANFSDHRRVLPANFLYAMQLPNPFS